MSPQISSVKLWPSISCHYTELFHPDAMLPFFVFVEIIVFKVLYFLQTKDFHHTKFQHVILSRANVAATSEVCAATIWCFDDGGLRVRRYGLL
jgi:hypothetical protein